MIVKRHPKSKLRILFIHNRYQQAGGEDVAFQLEVDLLKKDHAVDVLLFSNDHIVDLRSRIGTAIKSIYSLSSFRIVRKKILAFKPDVIHIHNLFFNASPSILVAAYKMNIPVVVTLHNYRLICANALLLRNDYVCELCINKKLPTAGVRYKCYRNSYVQSAVVTAITGIHKLLKTWNRCVSQYICLTEFSKNKLLHSSLQLQEKQFSVLPNFVPDLIPGLKVRKNFFLYVGRISKEKGVDVVLEAFLNLKTENLIVVGEGPDKGRLEKIYGSASNIMFVGKKDKPEVLHLMSETKALVFPSLCYENLPFTIIESFSTSTPVIASRLGAMLEIVRDGYNGFHFKPGESSDLVRTVLEFGKLNLDQQAELYVQARSSYEQKFHPDIHYQSLISVYEKVIEAKTK